MKIGQPKVSQGKVLKKAPKTRDRKRQGKPFKIQSKDG
jgi:hypothetical protein